MDGRETCEHEDEPQRVLKATSTLIKRIFEASLLTGGAGLTEGRRGEGEEGLE